MYSGCRASPDIRPRGESHQLWPSTFCDLTPSIPGKIALEEHVGNILFSGTFTTPFVNYTNEVNLVIPEYASDVLARLTNIDSRVAAMDAVNISKTVLLYGAPGIQGVFNTTFAVEAAKVRQ